MSRSGSQGKEILISNGIYRTLSRVESFLLRERLLLRTGRSGREILRQARRARPDAVLLEHGLPDLSAVEVCIALKDPPGNGGSPLVLIAGPSRPADIGAACLAAGCDRFIGSPRSPSRILAELADLLSLRARRHPRLSASVPVAVGRVASEFLGYSRDLSACGVLVESALKVERGHRLRLRLFLAPGDPPLIADAIVRRCRAGPESDQNLLGIELLDLDHAGDRQLGDFLRARDAG